ncbi:MAG: hypothetical protein WKF40_03255 [Thermoleophilaceae bacterium]
MDLAVDGPDVTAGADVDAGVGQLLVALAALHERARDEVDAEVRGGLAGPGDRGPVHGLGSRAEVLVAAQEVELLG